MTYPETLALTKLALGRALSESGRDPERARELVRQALAAFESAREWLEDHPAGGS